MTIKGFRMKLFLSLVKGFPLEHKLYVNMVNEFESWYMINKKNDHAVQVLSQSMNMVRVQSKTKKIELKTNNSSNLKVKSPSDSANKKRLFIYFEKRRASKLINHGHKSVQ